MSTQTHRTKVQGVKGRILEYYWLLLRTLNHGWGEGGRHYRQHHVNMRHPGLRHVEPPAQRRVAAGVRPTKFQPKICTTYTIGLSVCPSLACMSLCLFSLSFSIYQVRPSIQPAIHACMHLSLSLSFRRFAGESILILYYTVRARRRGFVSNELLS